MGNFRIGVRLCIKHIKTMITQTATCVMEEIMTTLKSIREIREAADINVCCSPQPFHVCLEGYGIFNSHRLVRAPGRQHFCRFTVRLFCCIGTMMAKIINGIIGSAYGFYMIVAHESTGRESGIILQTVVASIINFASSLRVQQLVDAKGRLQFQMSPMIEGVAKCVGNCRGPRLELLPI